MIVLDYVNMAEIFTETHANRFSDCQIDYMGKKERMVKSSYWTAKSDSTDKILSRVQSYFTVNVEPFKSRRDGPVL